VNTSYATKEGFLPPATTGEFRVFTRSREIVAPIGGLLGAEAALVPAGEPVFGIERPGRAMLFYAPHEILAIRRGRLVITQSHGSRVVVGNPLEALKARLESYQPAEAGLPAFATGAVGYLGYDCVAYLEDIPLAEKESGEDEACFLVFRRAVLIDTGSRRATLVAHSFGSEPAPGELEVELDRMQRALARPRRAGSRPARAKARAAAQTGALDPAAFQRAVGAIREHIRQGDIFQCVVSQRQEFRLPAMPGELFQALRAVSPAPYLFRFETAGQALVGASPELLVRVEGARVETCPIAGTRPRGETPDADRRFERQLRRSTKERAEHLMLVDLSRNDLGRVCRPGTVRVRDFMQVQRFSHVMHLVSTVEGELAAGETALGALFAAFPAGTLTGAPKIRAMEIIAALEKSRRGAYGGAVVLYDFRGELDSCITIRTVVVQGERAVIQAGAGVVADSRADRELDEIRHKSRAARKAIARAAQNQGARS
jgi:anthranilate synthase component 1